jgi:hypothetical protein
MSFTGFQLGLTDSLIEASKKVVENSAEYKKFFDGALKKFGVTSPAELTGDKKKEFFDYIDKNYNSDDESGKDGVKKEGKLPPALQKHIDKKKGKEDEDEKEEGYLSSNKKKAVKETKTLDEAKMYLEIKFKNRNEAYKAMNDVIGGERYQREASEIENEKETIQFFDADSKEILSMLKKERKMPKFDVVKNEKM